MFENTNRGVGCEVKECRHHTEEDCCSLSKIHVGCACGEQCTCCDSFESCAK